MSHVSTTAGYGRRGHRQRQRRRWTARRKRQIELQQLWHGSLPGLRALDQSLAAGRTVGVSIGVGAKDVLLTVLQTARRKSRRNLQFFQCRSELELFVVLVHPRPLWHRQRRCLFA